MIKNFVDNNCPVCGENESESKFHIRYSNYSVLNKIKITAPYPKVSLLNCKTCAHKYASPILNPKILENYYSQLNSTFYNENRKEFENRFEDKHNKIVSLIQDHTKKGKVLEIGCGLGFLLQKFKQNDWDAYGIEPSPFGSKHAINSLNLNVKNEFLTFKTYEKESFDVIMLFDVIEHLSSMKEMMDLIYHYLKPNGTIVLGTGNINSLNAKINGNTWAYFGTWEHISFFSPESLSFLLKRNSLNVIKVVSRSHQGPVLQNAWLFLLNLFFIRPLNLILPLMFRIFPWIKGFPGIKGRSLVRSSVATSRLAFDHSIIIGKKC